MRKALSIALLFVYVALFGGFKVSMHFCKGDLAQLSIYAVEETSCCAKIADGCQKHHQLKKMSCCEDRSVFLYSDINVKLDDYTSAQLVPKASEFEVKHQLTASVQPLVYTQANAPPTFQGRAAYELHSSYTFYG